MDVMPLIWTSTKRRVLSTCKRAVGPTLVSVPLCRSTKEKRPLQRFRHQATHGGSTLMKELAAARLRLITQNQVVSSSTMRVECHYMFQRLAVAIPPFCQRTA